MPIFVDRCGQPMHVLASILSDLLQAFPERVFKAEARFVSSNDNRTLDDCRFHDCPCPPANQTASLILRRSRQEKVNRLIRSGGCVSSAVWASARASKSSNVTAPGRRVAANP